MLIADHDERDPGKFSERLKYAGIHSSRDIGRVVYALIDHGLCIATETDSESDFAAIFETEQINEYLGRTGIPELRDWPVVLKSGIVWTLFPGGVALLFARALQAVEIRSGECETKRNWPKKRSLHAVNEYFEARFAAVSCRLSRVSTAW